MKTMLLVTVALLALPASRAFSQAECNGSYEACMNSCMPKSPNQQSSCIVSCQDKNNQCSVRYFGQPPQAEADPQPNMTPDAANDARDQAPTPAKKRKAK